MIKNPIKIKIKDAAAGYAAGEWCEVNFKTEDWDLWMEPGFWGQYTFEFANKQDATLFALRWAEYA
jgi:hypothetical protein